MQNVGLATDQKAEFKAKLNEREAWYLRGRRLWSLAYHSTTYGAALLSGAAALIPQLQGFSDPMAQKNIATVLAAVSAAMITISTAGGFQRKWQTNRASSTKVEALTTELIARNPTTADGDRLAQILDAHNKGISGD